MNDKIYLDNNATTFCDPLVIEEIQRTLALPIGNPSSIHYYGQRAKAVLIEARESIASNLKINPKTLVFTSGGTESLNYCMKGLFNAEPKKKHVITSNLEHSAVETILQFLEKQGANVERIPAAESGCVDPSSVISAIGSDTSFIVLIAANNETGVKTDLLPIAEKASSLNIPLVLDGVSWLGKELIPELPGKILWCFSAHKIHGPQGIGIATVPMDLKIEPLILGGGQERGRRGGTENLPGISGFSLALKLIYSNFQNKIEHLKKLRDKFENHLLSSLDGIHINGEGSRVANTSNLYFEGVDGETLLFLLDQSGIAASMGSACSSGGLEPSRILLNMGYPRERVLSSLRFSFSYKTTVDQIDKALNIIIDKTRFLRLKKSSID